MDLFVVVLFLLGAISPQHGALAGDNGKCEEFAKNSAGWCLLEIEGNITIGPEGLTLRGMNVGAEVPGIVQLGWNFQGWPELRFSNANGWSGVASTYTVILNPGQSDQVTLTPSDGKPVSASILVGFLADKPENLRGLTVPVVPGLHKLSPRRPGIWRRPIFR
jgi:hypothetical protein